MKIIRMGLRPWESPRRLQNPVEIALRTLIVVTTADTGRKFEEGSWQGMGDDKPAWIRAARAWTSELSHPIGFVKLASVRPSLSARHAIAL